MYNSTIKVFVFLALSPHRARIFVFSQCGRSGKLVGQFNAHPSIHSFIHLFIHFIMVVGSRRISLKRRKFSTGYCVVNDLTWKNVEWFNCYQLMQHVTACSKWYIVLVPFVVLSFVSASFVAWLFRSMNQLTVYIPIEIQRIDTINTSIS